MRDLITIVALTCALPAFAQEDSDACLQKATLIQAKGKSKKPLLASYHEGDHESVVANALLDAHNTISSDRTFGIAVDSARVIAELRSGNQNPYAKFVIDSGPPKNDSLGKDLYWISLEVGANYWTSDVINTVLPFLDCSTRIFLAKEPHRTDYIAFGLSTLIAAKKTDAALALMRDPKHNPQKDPGDFYLAFVKRYIGVSDYRQALKWMESVEDSYTVSLKSRRHWFRILEAAISRERQLLPNERRDLISELKRQEGKSTTPAKR